MIPDCKKLEITLPPNISLGGFHDWCSSYAVTRFSVGLLVPISLVIQVHNVLFEVVTPLTGNVNKAALYGAMKGMLHGISASKYGYISEAWFYKLPNHKKGDPVPPNYKDIAEKEEAMIVMSADHNSSIGTSWPITRNRWKVELGTQSPMGENLEGDASNLFKSGTM